MVYRRGPRDPFCRFDLRERSVRADESYNPEELKFLKIINEYREDHHFPTLLLSDALTEASGHHSEDMSHHNFFAHNSVKNSYFLAGSGPWDRMKLSGLSRLADKTVNLRFLTKTDGERPTTFYVDDVELK